MQKNLGDFSMRNAMELANSPAGQQLLNLLKNADSAALKNAMNEAASGNYEKVKQSLTPFLENPETQALLRQLGGTFNE